jgi:hypothetical protein
MSLPASEQRVLNHMEGALRAGEPHLVAMYAIFARLSAGEPVGAEPLSRGRLRRPKAAVCAMVLIPVMFALVMIGAVLSSSARGATTCGTSSSAVRGGPLFTPASCPPPRKTTQRPGQKPPKTQTSGTAASPERMLERFRDHASLGVPCRSSSSGMRQRSC